MGSIRTPFGLGGRRFAAQAKEVQNQGKLLSKERRMRVTKERRAESAPLPERVLLYTKPHHRLDRLVYRLLKVQVAITSLAVAYIVTPLQELFPIPQSYIDRFIPVPDPDSELANDIVVQDTLQRWVICIIVGWAASCLAIYFKRRSFLHKATEASLIYKAPAHPLAEPSVIDSYELEISYFFDKSRSLRSSDLIRESQVSAREWSVICKPEKPFSFFVFQEEHLTGASRGVIQNFMHRRGITEETLRRFDRHSSTVDPAAEYRNHLNRKPVPPPLRKS